MKVSVLQMPVAIGAREKNAATLRRMLETAMKDAPDVVVLPELWDVGFFPRPLEDYLDAGGERTKPLLSSLAKSCGVHIVGGSVAVRDGERAANRCYVHSPSMKKPCNCSRSTPVGTTSTTATILRNNRSLAISVASTMISTP